MLQRPRRLRQSAALRQMSAETHLQASDFMAPLFCIEGKNIKSEISSMPGYFRISYASSTEELDEAMRRLADAMSSLEPN